jgi:hypothetical protein
MMTYIVVIGFFVAALGLMGLGLHISQYKKRSSCSCGHNESCCTGDHDKGHSASAGSP